MSYAPYVSGQQTTPPQLAQPQMAMHALQQPQAPQMAQPQAAYMGAPPQTQRQPSAQNAPGTRLGSDPRNFVGQLPGNPFASNKSNVVPLGTELPTQPKHPRAGPPPKQPPVPNGRASMPPAPHVPSSRNAKHTEHADEIVPGIWVGSAQAATDLEFLNRANISAVLNMTKDVDNRFSGYSGREIEYMRIPVNDSNQKIDIDKMSQFLPHSASFIYKNRDIEGKNVLVHCAAGVQRSATAVVHYLHLYHNVPLTEAIEKVIRQRPKAFFHGAQINFRDSLQRNQLF